jgi:Family of unknown function (DUF6134)
MLDVKQRVGFLAAMILLTAGAAPASGAPRTYTYLIEHAPYGVVGTYTDRVDQSGETRRIDTTVRVAVRILGIVVYRKEADRTETWRGDQLLSFRSITTTNGKTIEVHGEARGDRFVIATSSGVVSAPLHIYTASPWSAGLPHPETMVVAEDGRVERAQVIGGEFAAPAVDGAALPVRRYEIVGEDRYYVWSTLTGVPLRFGIRSNGSVTNFVLRSEDVAALIAARR